MSEKKLIPKFRFKEFKYDWEQFKLGQIFEQTSKYLNPKEENIELWSLTVEKGLTPKTKRYNREFLVKKQDKFKAVRNNEFIYNPMNMTLGAVDLNLTGKTVAVSGYYITMKAKETFESKYFSIWLRTSLAIKMYKLYATGSLIERQRVQFPTLSQIKAYVPYNEEQIKIGNFFKQLDNTIILQQQLLDDHKYLKKAMLQKMFPQKGESVPRIRFAGYTSEWEIEPLSRLGKIMTGSTPSTLNKDNYSNEGIIWITPTDIKGRIVTKTSRKISEIGETGARIAPAGTILVTSIASIGKNTLLLTRAGFNQQINSLTPNKNNDSYFLFTQSEIWSEKMKKFASSGTMQIVNKTEFSSMKTSIPQLEEQEKIGNFFEQLDETIDLHEKKLETYQELKKAMLQKMFV